MGTPEVIATLSAIPIGTIIAWITVLAAICGAIITGTVKLYKVFEKTSDMKEENESFREMVTRHDEQLKKITESLDAIKDRMDDKDRMELANIRYKIVRSGEEYVSTGSITIRQLKVIEELYEEYHVKKNGNGYVTTLMEHIRALPVIGELDENDRDIIK